MTSSTSGLPRGMLNSDEARSADMLSDLFSSSSLPVGDRLDNFTKYVRLQTLTKFLVRQELFKRILPVKGSIVECGVFRGFGLMSWANLSAIFEPANFMRKIYGFDSFIGFPSVSDEDGDAQLGTLKFDEVEELEKCIAAFDANRYLGHMPKVSLTPGDATKTIPEFLKTHSHLVVALLYLDFDLYEPTKIALETFLPRMPKGGILAFDELDHPTWPGETLAALEAVGLRNLRLQRMDFDPYVAFAEIS